MMIIGHKDVNWSIAYDGGGFHARDRRNLPTISRGPVFRGPIRIIGPRRAIINPGVEDLKVKLRMNFESSLLMKMQEPQTSYILRGRNIYGDWTFEGTSSITDPILLALSPKKYTRCASPYREAIVMEIMNVDG